MTKMAVIVRSFKKKVRLIISTILLVKVLNLDSSTFRHKNISPDICHFWRTEALNVLLVPKG